jgi:hypothetical protein
MCPIQNAMQLLDFQLVDITKVALPEPKAKIAKKYSENILMTAHISDAIKTAYLGGDKEEDEEDSEDQFWVPGNALKMPNKMWS